jgi:hypothetical protein
MNPIPALHITIATERASLGAHATDPTNPAVTRTTRRRLPRPLRLLRRHRATAIARRDELTDVTGIEP